MGSARLAALTALEKCRRAGAWSDAVLGSVMDREKLSGSDRALCSALCCGVIQNYALLDYYIDCFSSVKSAKLEPKVRDVLRVSAYQLVFMDRIPPRAAVNEGVRLCKSLGYARAAGLVNAVLRRISEGPLPEVRAGSRERELEIKYSCPRELVSCFISLLGGTEAEALLRAQNEPPALSIMTNTVKTTAAELLDKLTAAGADAKMHPYLPDCILARDTGDVSRLPGFDEGCFYIQDAAARMAVMAAAPQPGARILDACSAPGGKSLAAAVMTGGMAEIVACDIGEKKLSRIEKSAARLGFGDIITTRAQDGSAFVPEWESMFDTVICDVPCSGLGVIRKKPDIRMKPFSEFERLPEIQLAILGNCARYVRPGGTLLYSTCTLRTEENEDVFERFAAENTDFSRKDFTLPGGIASENGMARFWPQRHGTDGFFAAVLRREK